MHDSIAASSGVDSSAVQQTDIGNTVQSLNYGWLHLGVT